MATVIIVDDSSMARRNLKNILISEGHSILAEATNGVQAFVEYENHKPDFVTMDITMPIMNGIDGTKKILKTYPNAKIIMVSALNQKLMILEALQNGAKHYIVKPFSYEKVVEVVSDVLKISSQPLNHENNHSSVHKQLDKIPNIPSSKSTKPEDSVLRPFFIEAKDGISVINISKSMSYKNIAALKFGIQRISSTKPIKVVFNFGEMEMIEDDIFLSIAEIFKSILELEGSCTIVSSNQNFVLNISEKNESIPIKLYSGKLNISDLDI